MNSLREFIVLRRIIFIIHSTKVRVRRKLMRILPNMHLIITKGGRRTLLVPKWTPCQASTILQEISATGSLTRSSKAKAASLAAPLRLWGQNQASLLLLRIKDHSNLNSIKSVLLSPWMIVRIVVVDRTSRTYKSFMSLFGCKDLYDKL